MSSSTNRTERIIAAAFSSSMVAKYGTIDTFFDNYQDYFTPQDVKAFKHWRQGHTKRDLPPLLAKALLVILEDYEPERYEAARRVSL